MKRSAQFTLIPSYFFALLALVFLSACFKEIDPDFYANHQSYQLPNISYGADAQQRMDIYLPANRNANSTKVFVLIHGGAWSGGDKSEFNGFFANLRNTYPHHAIINLNYRLGNEYSPGFPKQIDDIKSALQEIQLPKYNVSNQYCLIGGSAGAHLAMLYAYGFDVNHEVKAVCNTVGPTDITDPAYTSNIFYMNLMKSLVGNKTIQSDSALFAMVSPVKHVTAQAPPTLSFYGDSDILIPNSQLPALVSALATAGVYHNYTMYAGEGHGGWSQVNNADAAQKLIAFLQQYFP